MDKVYQVVIIGGGPAGLSAGLYTSRARLSTLLIERGLIGGLITETELIENYPGFPEGISGLELGQLMHNQATKYGLETLLAEITGLEFKQGQKIIRTTEGDFAAEAVIIASGSERLKLGVPGEKEFAGKGVSYCATCDAAFFRELQVAVAGSGDVGITEALYLTKFASKVTVIEILPKLGASRILQERAAAEPKIEFQLDTKVEEIEGDEMVKRLRLRQMITGEKSTLDVAGLFVSIGIKPNTDYLKGILSLGASGNIIINDKLETSIPGIFAAGDVRQSSAQQAITAAGDGAHAAIYAEKFISR